MREFRLNPDGSGALVELSPGPYSTSPPNAEVVIALSAADVKLILEAEAVPEAAKAAVATDLIAKMRAMMSAPAPATTIPPPTPIDPPKGVV